MDVVMRCPKCQQLFKAADPGPEGRVQCPRCQQRLRWIAKAPKAEPPAPAENFAPVRLVGRTPGKAPPRPAKPKSPGLIIAVATAGVVLVGVVGGLVYLAVSGGPTPPAPKPVESVAPVPAQTAKAPSQPPVKPSPPPSPPAPPLWVNPAAASATDLDPAALFAKASPAVVCIEVMNSDYQKQGQGSGFLVSSDGMVVTNYHVMRSGRKGLVRFGDDKAFPVVAVLAQDKKKDLAVLKINGSDMPYLQLLPEELKPAIGTRAFAIGTPAGYTNTLSEGLLSGLRDQEDRSVVQTTAAISSGSSGGPLMDARARVIGVNTYVHVEQSGARVIENLNFAVSSKHVREIVTQALAAKAKPIASTGGKPLDPASMADFARAYELIGKGKWLEAMTLAQTVRKKNPEDVPVLLLEGLLDTRLNFDDEAMRVYETVTRLSPDEPEALIGLGMIYAKKKMWKESADKLARTVKLRPEDASAQCALGTALLQLGRKDEALATLKEAVRLDDEVAAAWMMLGQAYLAQNLSGPAEDAFQKSVHLRPNPMAFAHLGMAAYQNGRFQEALKAAETALKMQPGLPYAQYVMGLALHRMGRRDEAEQLVEMLQKTDPDLSKKLRETIKETPAADKKKK
jgi:serine protease Do